MNVCVIAELFQLLIYMSKILPEVVYIICK